MSLTRKYVAFVPNLISPDTTSNFAPGLVVPMPMRSLVSSKYTTSDSAVLLAVPTHILPVVRLGTSFVLSIEETMSEPELPPDTLPTLATFCIKLLPVGFVNVSPPPDFTYTVSFELGVLPSIGSVVILSIKPPVIT